MTGGEAVVRTLLQNKVRCLYALPGIQSDWLFNALYDHREQIEVIHTRHEQGAAYMAMGAALATGELAVCNVVPGPGVLNAGAALATAYGLNAPLLLISSQVQLSLLGRGTGTLHEIEDPQGLLRGLTKLNLLSTHPAEIPDHLNTAIQAATTGRPRPVAVEIPMDVLAQRAPVQLPQRSATAATPVDPKQLQHIADQLKTAERPLIFVGSGAQNTAALVRELQQILKAPVVSYRTGRGIVDSRNPYSFVMPAARDLWKQADLVLALGTNMRVPTQSWPTRKTIRIDVDARTHIPQHGSNLTSLTARLEDALPLLNCELKTARLNAAWQPDYIDAQQQLWRQRTRVLQPQLDYLEAMRAALGETGIFVDELTQVGFASRIVMPVYHPRTFISTGYMGTLGYGFPTALGVKHARPAAPVVSVTGDGGFMFGVAELATAVQHKIPLATVLFNNNQYGNVQQMQRDVHGGKVIATHLVNPDFVQLAQSFGARGQRVTSPEQLRVALDDAFAASGPTLIEVPVGDMPSVDQFR